MFGIQVDEGVTPMMLGCQSTPGCKSMAVSMFYPDGLGVEVFEQIKYEWYRVPKKKIKNLIPEAQQHALQGGLFMRELTDVGRSLFPKGD